VSSSLYIKPDCLPYTDFNEFYQEKSKAANKISKRFLDQLNAKKAEFKARKDTNKNAGVKPKETNNANLLKVLTLLNYN